MEATNATKLGLTFKSACIHRSADNSARQVTLVPLYIHKFSYVPSGLGFLNVGRNLPMEAAYLDSFVTFICIIV